MKRNEILAGLAVAITICGLGAALPGASASAAGPKPATLAFVDKAKLPITEQVIKAFRNAPPSRKTVARHTDQLSGLSYRNVTRILVEIPARVAFGSGGRGTYAFGADFKGPIRPKNAVTVAVSSTSSGGRGYGFLLGRTTKDGLINATPMHWFMTFLGAKSRYFDSCSIAGGPGGYHPILSEPILGVALKQARTVIRRAVKRGPIQWQRDVVSSKKVARSCSS